MNTRDNWPTNLYIVPVKPSEEELAEAESANPGKETWLYVAVYYICVARKMLNLPPATRTPLQDIVASMYMERFPGKYADASGTLGTVSRKFTTLLEKGKLRAYPDIKCNPLEAVGKRISTKPVNDWLLFE